MFIILFQGAGEVASQPGAITLGILAAILGAINVYQLYKSREAGTWKGTANAYEAELGIVRARAERLATENQELTRQVGELKARTDLSQLARDSSEQHAGIVVALKELSETSARQHAQLTQAMSDQTKLFLGLQSHTASVFESVAEQFRSIKAELDRR
jgi:predicted  nucleic acid-binding Zn-ribbon protein